MPLPLWLLLLACRPDEELPGGYTSADDVQFVDGPEGLVRAHFSDRGPNAVDQTDQDGDDIPDRAEATAAALERTIRLYESWGFRRPPPESAIGLGALGGSDALDVYLVDLTDTHYGGFAAPDGCVGGRCGVHLVVASDDDDTRADYETVVNHELFHAVQAGYDYLEPAWLLEGPAEWAGVTAAGTWSDLAVQDYLDHTDCGLADINGLSSCEAAGYGASLLWFYLEETRPGALRLTLEATVTHDGVDALVAGLAAAGTTVEAIWPGFAAWNLATGPRSDGWSYGFARFPDGVTASAEGAALAVPAHLEPLSARYYRVDHAGGPLWLGVDGDPGPLVVTVHPVEDGAADGPIAPVRGVYGLPTGGALDLGDYDAGGVWVALSHPDPHGDAVDIGLCLGAEADVTPCRPGVHAVDGCATAGRPPGWFPFLLAFLGLARRSRP